MRLRCGRDDLDIRRYCFSVRIGGSFQLFL